jgi:hypothetical protein
MSLQLLSTNTVTPVSHCLIYGPAKSGKTRLIPTAPQPVICSSDAGLASIREHNLPFHEVQTYSDYLVFEQAATKGELNGFETVAIDDLTEIAYLFIQEERPKHKNLMQAYGALNDEMMRVIRFWRNQSAFTAVIICKQERIKDESTGGLIYAPMIPGKAVAPQLPYLFGSVYHTEEWTDPTTQAVHEVVRCKRNAQYDAGDRSGKLNEIEFANLKDIFAKVLS